jgi:hypothetical protein
MPLTYRFDLAIEEDFVEEIARPFIRHDTGHAFRARADDVGGPGNGAFHHQPQAPACARDRQEAITLAPQ